MKRQKWIISKGIVFLLGFIIVIGGICLGLNQKNDALAFVEKMGVGWNLGNALDVNQTGLRTQDISTYEISWGNPVTTREMIAAINRAGFSTLRIPVSWSEHMDASGNIDEAFLKRVHEVVDYGIDEGMYVIINIHHDEWMTPSAENRERALATLTRVWEQIAFEFRDYDEQLLYESMNEPRLLGSDQEWTAGTAEARSIVNELNARFVEVVRASGGQNQTRYLLIPAYCASEKEEALKDLTVPDDERIIVSVHAYLPYDFALNQNGTADWNIDNSDDTVAIETLMANLNDLFISSGIPVIITEFGALDKNNLEARLAWLGYFQQKAAETGIGLIWWDNGEDETNTASFKIFDRNRLSFDFPEIKDSLVD